MDNLRYRWNNYKANSRKFEKMESYMQGHLYRQFNSSGHMGFFNYVSVAIVDKTDGSDTKKGDDYPGAYLGYNRINENIENINVILNMGFSSFLDVKQMTTACLYLANC